MPAIHKGESRKAFVSRCVHYVMKEETVENVSHAVAKCHGLFDQHIKGKFKRYKKVQDKGAGE